MAVDKLVDSAKLNAALDYEASKIIAKGGGTAPLAFDFANEKGFGDYIDAIPSGGADISDWRVVSGTVTTTAISKNIKFNVGITGTDRLINCIGFYAGNITDLPPASDYSETYIEQICGWYGTGNNYMRNGYSSSWSPGQAVFRRKDDGTNSFYQGGTAISLATTGVVTVSNTRTDTAFMPGVTFYWMCVVGVSA